MPPSNSIEDVAPLLVEFVHKEQSFWATASEQVRAAVRNNGLQADSLLFYGEVAMVAVGLKPSAVLTGLDAAASQCYMASVVRRCSAWDSVGLDWGLVDGPLSSSDGASYDGLCYVTSRHHPLGPQAHSLWRDGMGTAVPTDLLAHLLDYPVGLPVPHSRDVMEIAYVDVTCGQLWGRGAVMVTYYALRSQAALVNAHFHRYRSAMLPLLDLRVAVTDVR